MAGYLHRTATTAYPCCVPTLGEFSRSWSCKTCRRKDREMREKLKAEKLKVLKFVRKKSVPVFVLIPAAVPCGVIVASQSFHRLVQKAAFFQTLFETSDPHYKILLLLKFGRLANEFTCVMATNSSARPPSGL